MSWYILLAHLRGWVEAIVGGAFFGWYGPELWQWHRYRRDVRRAIQRGVRAHQLAKAAHPEVWDELCRRHRQRTASNRPGLDPGKTPHS